MTAKDTKLGWTAIEKQKFVKKHNILTTFSRYVRNVPLNELCELKTIGISDPNKSFERKRTFDLSDFKDKMNFFSDGRYEVELPWKCDSKNFAEY